MKARRSGPGEGRTGFVPPGIPDASRLVGFSDGVFAIAATLLVLSLDVPDKVATNQELRRALGELVPSLLAYALSFYVISNFWLSHHRLFILVRRVDHPLLVLNLAFLGVVTVIPFPTNVFGQYGEHAIAVVVYAVTIGTAAALSTALFWWACHDRRLVDPATPDEYILHGTLRGATLAVVFLASTPLAAVDPAIPPYCWALAFVSHALLARRFGRIHSIYGNPAAGRAAGRADPPAGVAE